MSSKTKVFLEYLWYGVVLGIVITFLQSRIYNIDFSWFNVFSYMILCPLAIWLTIRIKIEFSSLKDGD